jgi:chemotaxis protein methyltransferase CheR
MTAPLTDAEFREISGYINANYGVDLKQKRLLIEARLSFYISSLGYKNYHEYFEYVKEDPTKKELANLLNRLTTNHTFFLREEDHFKFYRNRILPWVDKELKCDDLRVWSAGCSTGQEPYTLAAFTLNYLSERNRKMDSVILATDISERALAYADRGAYPENELKALPDIWRYKWFEKTDEHTYRVNEALRANVAFKRSNLLNPFSVKKPFHAIMCRNVMIYFDHDTRTRIMKKFHDALMPGGYLLVGYSESLSPASHEFEYVMPAIYRRPF